MDKMNVILVDGNDTEISVVEKIRAHKRNGMLHRAVSVVIFRVKNNKVETLMQKRSGLKLLWPGFWTNTICTHPEKNESYEEAGARRLHEEMGIRMPPHVFVKGFRFEYQAQYSSEFAEYELDTVLFLSWNGECVPDTNEVSSIKWIDWEELMKDMEVNPGVYTPWFYKIANNEKTKEFIKTL